MKKRLFVAISLPDELAKELAQYQEKFKNPKEFRFTTPENFHLTLHFIGYLDEERLPALQATLTETLRKTKRFEISFKEIIFAPPDRTKRMIWAVFESKEYEELSRKIADSLQDFSQLPGPDRPNIPHLTLARFQESSLAKSIRLPQPKFSINKFSVSRVELMESKLSPQGPTYRVIGSYGISNA